MTYIMKNEKTLSVSESVETTVKSDLVREARFLNRWLKRCNLTLEKIEECEVLRKEIKQLEKENEELKIKNSST